MDDSANLADEGSEALDSVGLLPKGFKEKVKTNFRNSMSVAALHRDPKSGTLHLHLDCCRVDNDGNDVHDVHIRAMNAAEIINARHGWEKPQEVRDMRQQEIAEFCEYTLQKMDSFDIDRYFEVISGQFVYDVDRGASFSELISYTEAYTVSSARNY